MRTVRRKTISIILLFIVSTMLIGILSGCDGIGDDAGAEYVDVFWKYTPELEPLTQSQADAFNKARFLHDVGVTTEEYIDSAAEEDKEEAKRTVESATFLSNAKSKTRPYLGTFNGSIVVANVLPMMEGSTYILGEYILEFPTYTIVYVYNSDIIYGIEEAYQKGLLTDEDAATIVERRNKYYDARYGETNQ